MLFLDLRQTPQAELVGFVLVFVEEAAVLRITVKASRLERGVGVKRMPHGV